MRRWRQRMRAQNPEEYEQSQPAAHQKQKAKVTSAGLLAEDRHPYSGRRTRLGVAFRSGHGAWSCGPRALELYLRPRVERVEL